MPCADGDLHVQVLPTTWIPVTETDRDWRVKDKTGSMRIGIYSGQLLEEAQAKAAKKAATKLPGLEGSGFSTSNPRHPDNIVAVQTVDPLGSRDARVREEERLRMELGMVMDSDDEKIINAAAKELDDFMAKVKK